MMRRRSWPFWALLLCCSISWCGCQCVGIVRSADGENTTPAQGTNATQDPSTTRRPSRYLISGVAMLAFYPTASPLEVLDPDRGTMNGYLLVYKEPNDTEIETWRLVDDQCERKLVSHTRPTASIVGRDGGREIHGVVKGISHRFERRVLSPQKPGSSTNVIYNFPTKSGYAFPYQSEVTFASGGVKNFPRFRLSLPAPARLEVVEPVLHSKGIRIRRGRELALRWRVDGEMPYMAVRINQLDPKTKETRSLLCRLRHRASKGGIGEGRIPTRQLRALQADPEGKLTRIHFFPTTYRLVDVEGLPKPLLVIVRATTTVPIVVE